MNIELFNFTKRTNSTLRPTTGGTTKTVRLKEPTDVLNPVFIMDGIDNTSTMCIWNGAYYFITNRVYITNSIMELHCSIDSAGTASDDIKNYTCFVERAASEYDTMIDDRYLSSKENIVNRGIASKFIPDPNTPGVSVVNTTGCYLVRTISQGDSNTSVSGVNTYAVPLASMTALLNYMFNDSNYSWLNTAQNEFIKSVFNPFDYIVSVKWMPFDATLIAGNTTLTPIKLGWWQTTANGYLVTQKSVVLNDSVAYPTEYYNDFRQVNPNYTQISIYLPFVGMINIPAIELTNGVLYYSYMIDCATGESTCYVRVAVNNSQVFKMLGEYPAKTSAVIQLAQTSTDLKRMTADLIGAASNLAIENYAAMATELVDAITVPLSPDKTMLGNNETMASMLSYTRVYCFITNYETAEFPLSVAGRPLMKNKKLGDLSGFVKCGNASIPLANAMIRDEVNTMLNSGIYIE